MLFFIYLACKSYRRENDDSLLMDSDPIIETELPPLKLDADIDGDGRFDEYDQVSADRNKLYPHTVSCGSDFTMTLQASRQFDDQSYATPADAELEVFASWYANTEHLDGEPDDSVSWLPLNPNTYLTQTDTGEWQFSFLSSEHYCSGENHSLDYVFMFVAEGEGAEVSNQVLLPLTMQSDQ